MGYYSRRKFTFQSILNNIDALQWDFEMMDDPNRFTYDRHLSKEAQERWANEYAIPVNLKL